tara:strand:- start:1132 stop:1989 length:858 start_codon:yes stop_codon:yes gene_type:complete
MAEGNAPSRPKITYHVNYLKSRKAAKDWDKKYSKTHNKDGSLKTKRSVQEDRKSARSSIKENIKKKKKQQGGQTKNDLLRGRMNTVLKKSKLAAEKTGKSISDSKKMQGQVRKSSDTMSDKQKDASRIEKIPTSSRTVSDSQKRRLKPRLGMSDSQKRRSKSSSSPTSVSDDQKKGQVRKVDKVDNKKPTQSSGGKTFKQAFKEGLANRKKGGGMNFSWKNPKDGKTRSYAAVTQGEVSKAHKAGKIAEPTLRSFLSKEKPKKDEKKKAKRGGFLAGIDKFLRGE